MLGSEMAALHLGGYHDWSRSTHYPNVSHSEQYCEAANATRKRLAVRQRAITLTFTVGAPPMNSAKGEPWAFTDSRFLYLPPHHCFSVPVLKPQVQSHSIALGSGGGHNPMSLESQYRVWRSS